MTSKKWLVLFIVTALLIASAVAAFNYITDPFGVFGDRVMKWYSYDMTNNPRTAKISYLDEKHGKYDSYIVGCSSTSSFPVDALNKYLGANFYNTIVYGADMLDSEQIISYIVDNYDPKNIVLNVYIDNACVYGEESNKYTHCMPAKLDGSSRLGYYARFLFANVEYGITKIEKYAERGYLPESWCVFDEESGAYDKRRRDVEPISSLEDYIKDYPVFADYPGGAKTMPHIEDTLASVRRIREKCDGCGVNLIVVTAPVYADYFSLFSEDDVRAFYRGLADVVDYWDFSYSSVSFEPRYFYDGTHFRNNVGYMAAAKIFGDDTVWMPDDFGYYVTAENADGYFGSYFSAGPMKAEEYTASVPILMYHHIAEETDGNSMIITPSDFESHIKTLTENGYTAVTLSDLRAYVKGSGTLPEKPVVITFDDGYESNYDYAYPILQKYGASATIFTIGSSVGKSTYKDTGEPIIPHFGEKEILEMISSGVISVQSHTYDMHQSRKFEGDDAREMMIQLDNESENEYIAAIREDTTVSKSSLESLTGETPYALAYPQGYHNDITASVLKEEGIEVTLSTRYGVNEIVKGLDQSLLALKRIDASTLSADGVIDAVSRKNKINN